MLTAYLNNTPYSKFVFIEVSDSLTEPARGFLNYIVNSHKKIPNCDIHYFVFEGNFKTTWARLAQPNVTCYDFVSDPKGWLGTGTCQDFPTALLRINKNSSVIVIDSLAHAIFQYGVTTIYKTLKQLLSKNALGRIITVLHQDLYEDSYPVSTYFRHISTLALTLQPKFNSNNGRVLYVYRKPGGKIIKKIEEYKFENGVLKTEPLKTIDPKMLVQQNLNQILPENLSTFRISLNDREKEARDKLVLPYLPKDPANGDQEEGKIFYQFDSVDDWDEEDPDDDLDI